MDPYLDDPDASNVREWYQNTFMEHYNGNRQPFGLYNHPIHRELSYLTTSSSRASYVFKAIHLTPSLIVHYNPIIHLFQPYRYTLAVLTLCLYGTVATGYPGVEDPIEQRNMINDFLDFAQTQQNVWIVTNQQLLAWMRNPVPVSVSFQEDISFYNLYMSIPKLMVNLVLLNCTNFDLPFPLRPTFDTIL